LIASNDANMTFAIFNYEKVQWFAGTNQGANSETGRGGKAARVKLILFLKLLQF